MHVRSEAQRSAVRLMPVCSSNVAAPCVSYGSSHAVAETSPELSLHPDNVPSAVITPIVTYCKCAA